MKKHIAFCALLLVCMVGCQQKNPCNDRLKHSGNDYFGEHRIRADNHDILGAFVLKGEMLSRGRSKKGFCAIIDGKIQLGMAESTPLLEEVTEKEGYFFRQYPLVMGGGQDGGEQAQGQGFAPRPL